MADMGAFSAAMASLRLAGDITKAMITLRDGQMIQAKVIELQGVILSAQQSALAAQSDQFSLLEKNREIERKISELEAWEVEKNRYELMQLYRGPFAYVLKIGQENGEPSHALCTNCYQRREKSILQCSGHGNVHENYWHCPACKAKALNQWKDMGQLIAKTREVAAAST